MWLVHATMVDGHGLVERGTHPTDARARTIRPKL